MHRESVKGPAFAKGAPLFKMSIFCSHILHLFDHPVGGLFVSRGAGQAWTVNIGQVEHVIHNLRVFEGFGLDTVDRS